MPYGAPSPASAVTPYRTTNLLLDVPETVLSEAAYFQGRYGSEIARSAGERVVDETQRSNVRLWQSGCWALKALQGKASRVHEYGDADDSVIDPSHMTLIELESAIAVMAIENAFYIPTDLLGVTASPAIHNTGDGYLQKQIPAGQSWDLSIDDADVPVPPPVGGDIPMDRIGRSTDTYPADQGWYLKWTVPGTSGSYPTWIWGFYFGQYALFFGGDGFAYLFEYCRPDIDAPYQWRSRTEFRYSQPGQIAGTHHNLTIFPHVGPSGETYLSFDSGNAGFNAGPLDAKISNRNPSVAPTDFLYRPTQEARIYDVDESPGHATKNGQFRFDMRRDIRAKIQVSTLAYETTGKLYDLPAAVPIQTSDDTPVNARMIATQPTGTSITPTLINQNVSETPWASTGDPNNPMIAKFVFASDGTATPLLWGYTLYRLPVMVTTDPTLTVTVSSFTEPFGGLCSVSLTGKSGDPSQETGSVLIKDVTGSLERLRNRGELACKLQVTYAKPDNDPITATIFRGYVKPVISTQKGMTGRVYPSPDYRDYRLPLLGMWARLQETDYFGMDLQFSDNRYPPCPESASPAPNPIDPSWLNPWRVTDGVKYLLALAGVPPERIYIQDNPVRLWPGATTSASDDMLVHGTNIAQKIVTWLRNYLGASLVYDESIGGPDGDGAWIIVYGNPVPPSGVFADPVWNFVSGSGGGILAPHREGALGIGTSLMIGSDLAFTNVPPAFNCFWVTSCGSLTGSLAQARVESHLCNHNSYPVPNSMVVPDPNHPDYLGRMRRYIHFDPSLNDSNLQLAQAACDWTARRLFDFLGHGQRLCNFTAPLVFIPNGIDGGYRTLRVQDPVALNGDATWLVKSVTPRYNLSRIQGADYELIQPIAPEGPHDLGQSVGGAAYELEVERTLSTKGLLRKIGHTLLTANYGNASLPPHLEQLLLNTPAITTYQTALQDKVTGQMNAMSGYS